MSPVNATKNRSDYQSFVVRVFLDATGGVDHGDVTHVSSRSRRTFATLEDAPHVMRGLISASEQFAFEAKAGTTENGGFGQGDATQVSSHTRRGLVTVEDTPHVMRPLAGASKPSALEANQDATEAVAAALASAAAATSVSRPPAPPAELVTGWESDKAIQRRVKRVIDVVAAAAGLVCLLFPMMVIAAAVRLDSSGPVIYRQERAGQGGRTFTMYKFRSMRADANDLLPALETLNERSAPVFKIRDDPRKTRVGRVLRRFSLDELPQLVNVLKGDLSLIGPRPPLASELAAYEPAHRQRLAVPQGLTGLWQVSGRSLLDFDEMLLLDLEYIRTWSLLSDLRILLRTIPTVLSGRGAF